MQNADMKNSPWAWVPSLYFAEGLPYVIVMTVSVVFYKQMGLSNAEITFYTSWLYLPWLIKPLWSPIVDTVRTKRYWIVAMQWLLAVAFAGVAFSVPGNYWLQVSLMFFWLTAFSSATHDIAADGFYMLGLSSHDQATFVGIRSLFYRLATIFGQGLLVMLAGNLQVVFRGEIAHSWQLVFYVTAAVLAVAALYHTIVLPRPKDDGERRSERPSGVFTNLWKSIATFFSKEAFLPAIFFMLCYRMPEGLLSKVSALFLIDAAHNGGLGLSPQEYGFVQGTVGIVGLSLGGILGGIAAGRDGLKRWLWPMVCAITLPDVVYVYLSYHTMASLMTVNVCVFIEQFGYGFGFTAYMLYLIYYSQGSYKTSHYAICTAFMALSMMLPGLVAGLLQEMLGYQAFFILVMIFCAITFVAAALVKIDPEFGKENRPNDGNIEKPSRHLNFIVVLIFVFAIVGNVFYLLKNLALVPNNIDAFGILSMICSVALIVSMILTIMTKRIGVYMFFAVQLVNLIVLSFKMSDMLWVNIGITIWMCLLYSLLLMIKSEGKSGWKIIFNEEEQTE